MILQCCRGMFYKKLLRGRLLWARVRKIFIYLFKLLTVVRKGGNMKTQGKWWVTIVFYIEEFYL